MVDRFYMGLGKVSCRIFVDLKKQLITKTDITVDKLTSLLLPPKLVWFNDNGPIPTEHSGNREKELTLLNNDIFEYNAQNGLPYVPRLNTLGVRR